MSKNETFIETPMKIIQILTIILAMTTMLSNAQNRNDNLPDSYILADGRVEHVEYEFFKTDRTQAIKRMDVVQRNKEGYVIRIEQSDKIEYWYFSLKNAQMKDSILTADIDGHITYNTYIEAYVDDIACGTVVSDRNTGIETLDFYFDALGNQVHSVLKWKNLPYNSDDSVRMYMRNRQAFAREEVVLPPKKWKDEKAKELMEKLGYYPIAGWYLKGENSNGKYSYSLNFSPTGEVLFRYFIEKEYQNGRFLTDVALSRAGTFDIDNDIIVISFAKLLGSRYNRPNPWDDPLEDNLTIKIKVERRGESGKPELIVTQISGVNIFENHAEHETLKFITELLPPLEI